MHARYRCALFPSAVAGYRTSASGELVLLEDQDRSWWNREQIAGCIALGERAPTSRRFGPCALPAAISAVHAEAGARFLERRLAELRSSRALLSAVSKFAGPGQGTSVDCW